MNDNPSLDALLAEEQELQFPSFGADAAWLLGNAIHQRAMAGSFPIAIEVSRNGQQLFFAALPGATPDNAEWIRRKRGRATVPPQLPLHVRRGRADGTPLLAALWAVRAGLCGSRRWVPHIRQGHRLYRCCYRQRPSPTRGPSPGDRGNPGDSRATNRIAIHGKTVRPEFTP